MIKPHHPGSGILSLKYTLMGALILIFLTFIIAITTLSFIENRDTIEDSFSKEENNSEKFLTESILYINRGLKLWDTTYDTDLRDALVTLRTAYERSGNVTHLNDHS